MLIHACFFLEQTPLTKDTLLLLLCLLLAPKSTVNETTSKLCVQVFRYMDKTKLAEVLRCKFSFTLKNKNNLFFKSMLNVVGVGLQHW